MTYVALPDFYVGEYGDPIEIAMPFDASGDTVTIEARKPSGTLSTWSGGFTVTDALVLRLVLDGELDEEGIYNCAVVCVNVAEARERRVKFELRVASSTPR